jgi:hypothetical protein
MQSFADHQTPIQHKHRRHRVELQYRPGKHGSKWQVLQYPPLVDQERHDARHSQTRKRYRRPFEILRLACLVFRQHRDCDVEPRKACKAAEDEKGQQHLVDGGAEDAGKGCRCGGDAEGDEVRERVQLLAHEGGLFTPAGDFAVEEVEKEAAGHEAEGEPEIGGVGGVAETVAHGGEDGHDWEM